MFKYDGRKLDHKTSESLRLLAIKQVKAGVRPSSVMASLGLCRTTIYRWMRAEAAGGEQALLLKKSAGPAPKLTAEQAQTVRTWIVGKDPRQLGLDFGLWTRKIIQTLIAKNFQINIGLTAIGKMLAKLDITPQKPLRRAYERDPERVEQWVKQTFPALRTRAKKEKAAIFFLDEAGFSSEPNLGRTYGLKGKTPVVKTTGQRQKVNAISAISPTGAFWSNVYTGKFNAARFVEFLKDFRRGGRGKVFLVVDGHPCHHAKVVQAYVAGTEGGLELHFLPPYAPDLNPDEFVWHYAKANGVSKKPLMRNESLKTRIESDMQDIKENRKLVKSFFYAKTVAYTVA
jgi:transposase